jgi:hypothetical protein
MSRAQVVACQKFVQSSLNQVTPPVLTRIEGRCRRVKIGITNTTATVKLKTEMPSHIASEGPEQRLSSRIELISVKRSSVRSGKKMKRRHFDTSLGES